MNKIIELRPDEHKDCSVAFVAVDTSNNEVTQVYHCYTHDVNFRSPDRPTPTNDIPTNKSESLPIPPEDRTLDEIRTMCHDHGYDSIEVPLTDEAKASLRTLILDVLPEKNTEQEWQDLPSGQSVQNKDLHNYKVGFNQAIDEVTERISKL